MSYHLRGLSGESKWEAEEIVRRSGIEYTIFKAGVIYGRGDHMLDHLSHALHTFRIFGLVGFKDQPVRPLAVEDLVKVALSVFDEQSLKNKTVASTGPEKMTLRDIVSRVAAVIGRKPIMIRLPLWSHYASQHFWKESW